MRFPYIVPILYLIDCASLCMCTPTMRLYVKKLEKLDKNFDKPTFNEYIINTLFLQLTDENHRSGNELLCH